MITARRAVLAGVLGVVIAVVVVLLMTRRSEPHYFAFENVTSQYPNLSYPKRSLFVFRDRKLLAEHLTERTGKRGHAVTRIELPAVDFNRQMLIVVAMGARSSTGYRLEPISVTRSNGDTEVRVREISPSREAIVAPVLTNPYLALIVPRAEGKTRLHLGD